MAENKNLKAARKVIKYEIVIATAATIVCWKVIIQYKNQLFPSLIELSAFIASQDTIPDSTGYIDYSDQKPDMVIPQQEKQICCN